MSRVVKNVIVWVLALAVILCIIAGFTFGLSSVRSAGVALADGSVSSYVNGGVVRENILRYSTVIQLDSLDKISVVDSTFSNAVDYDDYNTLAVAARSYSVTDDGCLNVYSQTNSSSDNLEVVYVYRYSDPSVENIGFSFTVNFKVNYIIPSSSPSIKILYYLPNQTSSFKPIGMSKTISSTNLVEGENFIATVSGVVPSGYDLYGFQIDIPQNRNYGGFLGCVSPFWFKTEIYSGDTYGFTGYVPYVEGTYEEGYDAGYNSGVTDGTETGYNSGYDEGYNAGVTDGTQSGYDEGYDDGYNAGYANGQVSVRDLFTYSAVNIGHDPNDIYHCYVVNGDSYKSYQDVYLGDIGLKFVPLSKMRYYGYDGGYYPIDLVLPEDGENIPNVADSEYYLEFSSVVEVGQWLLDNPTDFLCSYIITGEMLPAVLVFSDLSGLSSFMSGAGYLYDDFYNDGYDDGFSSGDRNGYNRGYGVGFNDGQVDALDGNYTFLGLIGSVIDAPISAFRGLLDFELLGVNMSSFVLAVMSLCVIIVIIRMVLR